MNLKLLVAALAATSLEAFAASPRATLAAQPAERDLGSTALRLSEFLFTEEVVPKQGLTLGIGWSRALAQKMSARCVVGVEVPVSPVTGGSYTVVYRDIYDREQIARALKVSVKASYAAVSGSAEYSRTAKIDNSKRNILAVVTVDKGGTQLTAPATKPGVQESKIALTPVALKMLTDRRTPAAKRVADFQRVCGDSFVGTIRFGGRLTSMFNFDQSLKSMSESFAARISGGYGAFSGSASVSSSVQSDIEKTSTEMNATQEGGALTVALTAKEVLDKLRAFPTFDPTLSTSSIAVMVPYQTLPDWPKELDFVGISDLELQAISTHGGRLFRLAQSYADAATNPTNYYYPFRSPDTNELATIASGLYAAASCMEGLAALCSVDTSCDSKALSTVQSVQKFCPGIGTKLDEREKAVALSLMLDKREVTLLAGESSIQTLGRDVRSDVLRNRNARKVEDEPWSIYDVYYKFLAEAPLFRTAKDEPKDEAYQVEVFCDVLSGRTCAPVDRSTLWKPADAAAKAIREEVYRRWVTVNRLGPVASSFCEISLKHPMCRDTVALLNWSNALQPVFGEERNFLADPLAPTKVQATTKVIVPRNACDFNPRLCPR